MTLRNVTYKSVRQTAQVSHLAQGAEDPGVIGLVTGICLVTWNICHSEAVSQWKMQDTRRLLDRNEASSVGWPAASTKEGIWLESFTFSNKELLGMGKDLENKLWMFQVSTGNGSFKYSNTKKNGHGSSDLMPLWTQEWGVHGLRPPWISGDGAGFHQQRMRRHSDGRLLLRPLQIYERSFRAT